MSTDDESALEGREPGPDAGSVKKSDPDATVACGEPSRLADGGVELGDRALDHAPALRIPGAAEERPANMAKALELVGLSPLMELTSGRPEIAVGLLDGPIAPHQAALEHARFLDLSERRDHRDRPDGAAYAHGTFVAGILASSRDCLAPGICPGCTFLVRPIFRDAAGQAPQLESATTTELAEAIVDCVQAGASVLNLSAATAQPTTRVERALKDSLDFAARRGVLVVAAGGNQGTLGTSVITRHPWVVPVVGCDGTGRPTPQSNLAASLGRRGLTAPAEVTSLGIGGQLITLAGTSFAAPFVAGTMALLWSLYPAASPAAIRDAVVYGRGARRRTLIPPLLDARAAHAVLALVFGEHRGVVHQRGGVSYAGTLTKALS